MKPTFLFTLLCQAIIFTSCSQETALPFYDEIQAFKKKDRDSVPPKNAILFVGSSSIAMWKDLDAYFPGYTVINRGFGGSGLTDAIGYADDIIIPYEPKQVVIYSGENDIATGTVTSKEVLERFIKLFNIIRKDLPGSHIVYISIKPSPSREKFMPIMEDANSKIKQFLSGNQKTTFVDVFHLMLGADGKPRKELFLDDDLHMNEKGYTIWRDAIRPHLLK